MPAITQAQRDSWAKQLLPLIKDREGYSVQHEGLLRSICNHANIKIQEIREIKIFIRESPEANADTIIAYTQSVLRNTNGCGSCIGLTGQV